ncbi:hypothetical protein [Bacillus sp. RO1]|nr:hypothetical protein [Bacillus sp. RO1]
MKLKKASKPRKAVNSTRKNGGTYKPSSAKQMVDAHNKQYTK